MKTMAAALIAIAAVVGLCLGLLISQGIVMAERSHSDQVCNAIGGCE